MLSRRVCLSIQGPSTRDPRMGNPPARISSLPSGNMSICPTERAHPPREEISSGSLTAPSYTRQPLKGPIQGPGLNWHTLAAASLDP